MAASASSRSANTRRNFGAFVKEDIARWAKLVKETALRSVAGVPSFPAAEPKFGVRPRTTKSGTMSAFGLFC